MAEWTRTEDGEMECVFCVETEEVRLSIDAIGDGTFEWEVGVSPFLESSPAYSVCESGLNDAMRECVAAADEIIDAEIKHLEALIDMLLDAKVSLPCLQPLTIRRLLGIRLGERVGNCDAKMVCQAVKAELTIGSTRYKGLHNRRTGCRCCFDDCKALDCNDWFTDDCEFEMKEPEEV